MYPTDEIYGYLFTFTDKDYPNTGEEQIEEVEYNPPDSRRLQELQENSLSQEMVTGY